MEIGKFKDIVQHNIENTKEALDCAEKFYSLLGLDLGSEIKNLTQVVRPLFLVKGFITIQLPLKDKEIGAFCFKGSNNQGYIIINSSLPPYNVNFALCHEVCHICVKDDIGLNTAELFIDDNYFEHSEERLANQFAGIVLMPETNFRRMYEKFSSEIAMSEGNVDINSIVCKLMCYFEAPYMAVLIRLCELGIIEIDDKLVHSINVKESDIESIYNKYWLDVNSLKPSYRDDYPLLRDLLLENANKALEENLVRQNDVEEALENISMLYEKLKEEQ